MDAAKRLAPVVLSRAESVAVPEKWQAAKIQTLRGLACLLLVSFHVIGDAKGGGLRVDDDSIFRLFTNAVLHIRMPLFAFLSGFVYAYSPVVSGGFRLFLSKKLVRLWIPLVVVSTLYFVLQHFLPGSNRMKMWSHMWEIFVLPFAHYWFLQSALVLFVTIAALELTGVLKSGRGFLAIFGAALVLHWHADISAYFGASGAAYLAPFMLAGIAVHRFPQCLRAPLTVSTALVALMGMMTWHVLSTYHGHVAPKGSYFGTILGLVAVIALVEWMPRAKWLAWIGAYSFTIYLYHVFFSSATRSVLKALHFENTMILFSGGLILALLGPILLEIVLRRNAMARLLLLGQGASRARIARLTTADAALVEGSRTDPVRGHRPSLRGERQDKSAA